MVWKSCAGAAIPRGVLAQSGGFRCDFFFFPGRGDGGWDLQLCESFALLSLTSDDMERILFG